MSYYDLQLAIYKQATIDYMEATLLGEIYSRKHGFGIDETKKFITSGAYCFDVDAGKMIVKMADDAMERAMAVFYGFVIGNYENEEAKREIDVELVRAIKILCKGKKRYKVTHHSNNEVMHWYLVKKREDKNGDRSTKESNSEVRQATHKASNVKAESEDRRRHFDEIIRSAEQAGVYKRTHTGTYGKYKARVIKLDQGIFPESFC